MVDALSKENREYLFRWYQPDIAKIDCEGCERLLLDLSSAMLNVPRAWVIETHTLPLWNELLGRFRLLGYRITKIHEPTPMRTNPDKVVGLFQAVRDG